MRFQYQEFLNHFTWLDCLSLSSRIKRNDEKDQNWKLGELPPLTLSCFLWGKNHPWIRAMSHIWYNDHLKALQIVCYFVSESFYFRGQDSEFFTIVKKSFFFSTGGKGDG